MFEQMAHFLFLNRKIGNNDLDQSAGNMSSSLEFMFYLDEEV